MTMTPPTMPMTKASEAKAARSSEFESVVVILARVIEARGVEFHRRLRAAARSDSGRVDQGESQPRQI